jgi:hypothetical protein
MTRDQALAELQKEQAEIYRMAYNMIKSKPDDALLVKQIIRVTDERIERLVTAFEYDYPE